MKLPQIFGNKSIGSAADGAAETLRGLRAALAKRDSLEAQLRGEIAELKSRAIDAELSELLGTGTESKTVDGFPVPGEMSASSIALDVADREAKLQRLEATRQRIVSQIQAAHSKQKFAEATLIRTDRLPPLYKRRDEILEGVKPHLDALQELQGVPFVMDLVVKPGSVWNHGELRQLIPRSRQIEFQINDLLNQAARLEEEAGYFTQKRTGTAAGSTLEELLAQTESAILAPSAPLVKWWFATATAKADLDWSQKWSRTQPESVPQSRQINYTLCWDTSSGRILEQHSSAVNAVVQGPVDDRQHLANLAAKTSR